MRCGPPDLALSPVFPWMLTGLICGELWVWVNILSSSLCSFNQFTTFLLQRGGCFVPHFAGVQPEVFQQNVAPAVRCSVVWTLHALSINGQLTCFFNTLSKVEAYITLPTTHLRICFVMLILANLASSCYTLKQRLWAGCRDLNQVISQGMHNHDEKLLPLINWQWDCCVMITRSKAAFIDFNEHSLHATFIKTCVEPRSVHQRSKQATLWS